MDLLAPKGMLYLSKGEGIFLWILIFGFISPNLYAANPYNLGEVEYFSNPLQTNSDSEKTFDWREPVTSSDGGTSFYTPPEPMLTLLENPTLENAQAYVQWQRQRVEKITKAQQAIDQVFEREEE